MVPREFAVHLLDKQPPLSLGSLDSRASGLHTQLKHSTLRSISSLSVYPKCLLRLTTRGISLLKWRPVMGQRTVKLLSDGGDRRSSTDDHSQEAGFTRIDLVQPGTKMNLSLEIVSNKALTREAVSQVSDDCQKYADGLLTSAATYTDEKDSEIIEESDMAGAEARYAVRYSYHSPRSKFFYALTYVPGTALLTVGLGLLTIMISNGEAGSLTTVVCSVALSAFGLALVAVGALFQGR